MHLEQTICAVANLHDAHHLDQNGSFEDEIVCIDSVLGDARAAYHTIRKVGFEELSMDVLENSGHIPRGVETKFFLYPSVAAVKPLLWESRVKVRFEDRQAPNVLDQRGVEGMSVSAIEQLRWGEVP